MTSPQSERGCIVHQLRRPRRAGGYSGHQGCGRAGAAGNKVDAGGRERVGQGHRRLGGGAAARQPRLPRPRGMTGAHSTRHACLSFHLTSPAMDRWGALSRTCRRLLTMTQASPCLDSAHLWVAPRWRDSTPAGGASTSRSVRADPTGTTAWSSTRGDGRPPGAEHSPPGPTPRSRGKCPPWR
jgi:hypothetical protein